jgi:hypothetical protein
MEVVKGELTAVFMAVKEKLTIHNFILYLIEGIAVAIAAYVIPNRRTKFNEVAVISAIAALSFFILDVFSDTVGAGSRLGAGLGIGYNLVNIASPLPLII